MPSNSKDRVSAVHEARNSVFNGFQEKWTQMEDNSRFLRLLQYSDKQLKSMAKDKRVPYVLDFINNAINTYQGIQRDRRTDIYYYPFEKGDEVTCEVLNVVKDAKLRENNFIYTESDVFLDGLVQKIGAVTYEWSREKNKNGSLRIKRLHPRSLMWALFSREYDKTDSTWMAYHEFLSRREIAMRVPDKKKIVDKLSDGVDEIFDLNLSTKYLESLSDPEMNMIALVTYFEKHWEPRFFIRDQDTGMFDSFYFDTQKDAEAHIAEGLKRFEAETSEIKAQGGDPQPPNLVVFKDKYPVVRKTVVANDEELEHKTLDEPFYPIDIYHPYYVDGDWYCPLDVQKDSQRYYNKMFSMADHWISSAAKGLILYDEKSVQKDEITKVEKAWSTTGGLIGVRDLENYKEVNTAGPNPAMFSLMEQAKGTAEENAGGKNFMGRKESASESGVAVRSRVEQAGLSAFVIFDNLRRWKQGVGEHVAWYLTHYLTYPEVVRIEGEELVQEVMQKFNKGNKRDWFQPSEMKPGVGFFEINTVKANTIEDLKVDVIVDEARWSVSKNQSILQEMNLAMQSNPNLAKTFPPEVILEFLNLPFSEKEKARERIAQLEKLQMLLEAEKVKQKASVSASLSDVLMLPPEAAAQFLSKYFGIQVDPNKMQSPDEMEKVKMLFDLKMKGAEHQMDMKMKSEEHAMDMQSKREENEMKTKSEVLKIGMDHVKNVQSLKHNEAREQAKNEAIKTNGKQAPKKRA